MFRACPARGADPEHRLCVAGRPARSVSSCAARSARGRCRACARTPALPTARHRPGGPGRLGRERDSIFLRSRSSPGAVVRPSHVTLEGGGPKAVRASTTRGRCDAAAQRTVGGSGFGRDDSFRRRSSSRPTCRRAPEPALSSFVLGARQDDAGWDARDELPVGRRGAMGWRRLRRISRLVLKKLDGIFLSSHFYSLTLTHNAQRNTHGQRRRRCRARACRPAPLLPARSLPTTPPSRTRLSCPRHHTGTSKSWTRWTR